MIQIVEGNKQLTIHNQTEDGSYYWIVEQTDGLKWDTVQSGYEVDEAAAQSAASPWLAPLTSESAELLASKKFGEVVLFEVEAGLLRGGVNSHPEMAAAISAALFPISYALEKGRLHIALYGLGQFLTIPEVERVGYPFTADAGFIPVYNKIARYIGEPTL